MTSFEFFIDAFAMLALVTLATVMTSLTFLLGKKLGGLYDD
jgi:hypothetical protein